MEENMNYQPQPEQPYAAPVMPEQQPPKKKSLVGAIAMLAVGVIAICASAVIILGGYGIDFRDFGSGEESNPERDAFINELGGVSETFEGVVSTESYYSSYEAASAFVSNELSGYGYAEIQNVNVIGELSDSEIESLKFPDYVLHGYDAIEKVEVTYQNGGYSYWSRETASGSDSESKTVVVYVIKYGVDWKYFAPLPETGDTINKSYYDSVFNTERYQNCTLEQEQTVEMHIEVDGETVDMTVQMQQLIMYEDGKLYMEQKSITTSDGVTTEQTIYLYIEEDQYGSYICYAKMDDGEWNSAYLQQIGYSDLEELTPFYDQYLDYTYFTKTNYGFALADDNARKYFSDALSQAFGAAGVGGYVNDDDMELDMYAEYYVCDGVLSGMRVNASVDLTLNVYGQTATLEESIVSTVKCTDYGTTVIERPIFD